MSRGLAVYVTMHADMICNDAAQENSASYHATMTTFEKLYVVVRSKVNTIHGSH
jgi:hypothetical protein